MWNFQTGENALVLTSNLITNLRIYYMKKMLMVICSKNDQAKKFNHEFWNSDKNGQNYQK